jgi:hypothetical protein
MKQGRIGALKCLQYMEEILLQQHIAQIMHLQHFYERKERFKNDHNNF